MPTYDNPQTITYTWPVLADWGTAAPADGVYSIKGPAGKKGRITDIGVSVTEVFACDSTPGYLNFGATAGAFEYARLIIPDATAAGDHFGLAEDTDAVTAWAEGGVVDLIPADQQVEVTVDVGVDAGTETGQGYIHFTIDWF